MAYQYENVKLEKGMYGQNGRSFLKVLESLDPSENYKGTALEGLDAFQRQLKRFDIHVKGAGSDMVEKFFHTSESSVLFPEFVSRVVRQGMESDILPDITATVTNFDGMDYRSIASVPTDDDKELKGMYGQNGRSFLKVLESLDPSENYKGTALEGLDAFQRQLKRFDIHVKGAGSDMVEKFFHTSESSVLFPEFVSRVVRQGMESDILPDITATVTNFDGMDYRSIASVPTDDDKELKRVEEGAGIPTTSIRTQENLVKLHKRGRMLVASYEAIRFQRLDLFSVTLRQIGAYIARMHLKDAIDVLMNGDGNNNAATSYTIGDGGIGGTKGTLSYDALLGFWSQFDPYTMNTMLMGSDVMLAMLKLSEFQNPLTGLNFQGTGTLATPLGAKLLRTSAMPAGKIIGLDKNYALERICGSEVLVEYDKLIDRQLERAAITSISGFAKPYQEASKVLSLQ